MIAPIRPQQTGNSNPRVNPARRAVAEVLFSRPAQREVPRAPSWATGLFLAWLLGVTASFLLTQSWWTLRRP